MSIKEVLPIYTVEDYLQWEGDWELWEGHPVAMAPSPSPSHQNSGSNLVFQLMSQLKSKPCSTKCRVFYELDWHMNHTTVVRSDIMIYCHGLPDGKWISKPPTSIAEILSPSTRDRDLIAKKSLYAENGVKYYLVADPESKEVELFQLGGDLYEKVEVSTKIKLTKECEIVISAEQLFL